MQRPRNLVALRSNHDSRHGIERGLEIIGYSPGDGAYRIVAARERVALEIICVDGDLIGHWVARSARPPEPTVAVKDDIFTTASLGIQAAGGHAQRQRNIARGLAFALGEIHVFRTQRHGAPVEPAFQQHRPAGIFGALETILQLRLQPRILIGRQVEDRAHAGQGVLSVADFVPMSLFGIRRFINCSAQ